VARTRAARASLAGQIEFVEGDAQALPFPDGTFDIVTVAYGLRNLSSWERGLEEMFRVARPGARLVVLDFGRPDFAPWRALYFAYLRVAVPCFGRCFAGDAAAYAYILESLQHYPAQRGVEAKLRALSCREVRCFNLLGGVMSIHRAVKG
jgi:demethylmenaquinone methyltransferase/2-methoxy-6-polyprenyl-1,4-benzoquinol methylase